MKGYKLGMEDGKTGRGGYGSKECSVSMSNKSCLDYAGYSSICGKNPDGCDKYNPIKPIGYHLSSIPLLSPPPIKNLTRLVYDNDDNA
jgi:hypothetical protein